MERTTTKRYKGPISGPCSACGDGDIAMRFHSHEPPSQSYTLDDLQSLASTYINQLHSAESKIAVKMMMDAWWKWLERRARGHDAK